MKRFFLRFVTPFLAAVAAFLFVLLLYRIAFAADAATTTAKQSALQEVIDYAFKLLGVVLIALGSWVAHKIGAFFEKKTGIDIPDAQEQQIDNWIEQGIHLAEEKSRNKVKEKTGKLAGNEKLDEAVRYVFDLAQTRGWLDWTETKIRDKTEAWLGIKRAAGTKPELDKQPAPGPAPLQPAAA